MDTELTFKLVTAAIALIGAPLGTLHYLTTKRSVGHQISKTEIEILSQGIAAPEVEPNFKSFLIDVRKEKISSLVFGIPIPNADIERVITYYRNAEGKVTTEEIAKAWQYRDPCSGPLSFPFRGQLKKSYIFMQTFGVFCILSMGAGLIALVLKIDVKPAIALVCVSLVSLVFVILTSQDLLTAARLAKLEKERRRVPNDGAPSELSCPTPLPE